MADVAYVENTNEITLTGLQDEITNTYLNFATVTVTVVDNDGNPVAGTSWPLVMLNVDPTGDYRVALPAALAFVNRAPCTAIVDANASSPPVERIGHWVHKFTPVTRT